jgi:hypothetical protein
VAHTPEKGDPDVHPSWGEAVGGAPTPGFDRFSIGTPRICSGDVIRFKNLLRTSASRRASACSFGLARDCRSASNTGRSSAPRSYELAA